MGLMSYLQWLSPEEQKQFFNKIDNWQDTSNNTPVDQRMSTVNRTDYPQTLGWPDLKPQSVNWFTLSEEQPWQSWWPWQSWQSSQLQPWQWISLQDLSNITWVKPMSDTELQNQVNNDTQKILPTNTFITQYGSLNNTQDKIDYMKNLISNWTILKNQTWQVVDLEQNVKNLEASQTSTNNTDNFNNIDNIDNTNNQYHKPKAWYFTDMILWNITNFIWGGVKWMVDTAWTINDWWFWASQEPQSLWIQADNAILKMFWRKPMYNQFDAAQKAWADSVNRTASKIDKGINYTTTADWYFWWEKDYPYASLAWDITQFAISLATWWWEAKAAIKWSELLSKAPAYIRGVLEKNPRLLKYTESIVNATTKLAEQKWVWWWLTRWWIAGATAAWKSIWEMVAYNATKWKWTSENELIASAILWVWAKGWWALIWWAYKTLKDWLSQIPNSIKNMLKQMTPEEAKIAFKSLEHQSEDNIKDYLTKTVTKFIKVKNRVPSQKVLDDITKFRDESLKQWTRNIPENDVLSSMNNFFKWINRREGLTKEDRVIKNMFNNSIKWSSEKWLITPKHTATAKKEIQDHIDKKWISTPLTKAITNRFDDLYKKYIPNWEQIVKNNKIVSKSLNTDKKISKLITDDNIKKAEWTIQHSIWWKDTFQLKNSPLNETLSKIKSKWWKDWNKIYTLWLNLKKFIKEDENKKWIYYYGFKSGKDATNQTIDLLHRIWRYFGWWVTEKDFLKYTKWELTPEWQNAFWEIIKWHSPLELVKLYETLYPNSK